MANELVVFENTLKPLTPHFEQALGGLMPVDRLVRTAIVSVERNPYLLECNQQSLLNSIMTAAVLGLEMDGVTGQCFPIPFKKKVQLVIGYKGYNTLGARAGLTITGEVVRDGDEFDYMLGTEAFVRHKPKLSNRDRIIGAWAQPAANDRPPIVAVMGIDELLAVKEKSPGAKKDDSPWNNVSIGFPAMCSKTVKRRLARCTPLNVMQLAARMEEAFDEQGLPGHIRPDRQLVIEGDFKEEIRNQTPAAEDLTQPLPRNDPSASSVLEPLMTQGRIAAAEGMRSLEIWWTDLQREVPKAVRERLVGYRDETLKPMAAHADQKLTAQKAAQPETLEG